MPDTPLPHPPPVPAPAAATPPARSTDWVTLMIAAGLYSGSFALIELGLETAPASVIVMGRLWIGTIAVWAWMRHRRRRLPPLMTNTRFNRQWLWLIALGALGNLIPFSLISIGQETVDSAVAGILMAVMPLTTIGLAHFFVRGERLTWRKGIGFLIGFLGMAILFGPSAFANAASAHALAQAMILVAAICYAITSILARRAPDFPPSVMAAGMLLTSAIGATPFGLVALAQDQGGVSLGSALAILVLGVGSTGVATILIMQLIRGPGPSFLAVINYIIPVVATGIGLAIGDTLGWNAFVALGVILAGVAIATRTPRRRARE